MTAGAPTGLFIGLGVATRLGATRSLNRRVREKVRPRANANATRTATAISYFGTPKAHLLLAAGLALAVRVLRGRGGPRIIAASLGATAVDKLSRVVIHQKRPRRAGKHHGLDRFAFPSGHTCAITAILTATAAELSAGLSVEADKVLWASVACLAMGMGWSRLYLDEHWIDDVVGGLSAGLAVGLSVAEFSEQILSGGKCLKKLR